MRVTPTTALAAAAVPDTPAGLVAAARALVPVLRARARQAEAAGRLPPATRADLLAAGVFHILRPRRHGGLGLPPRVLWEVVRELGRGCGSTAWIASLLGLHAGLVGVFDERAQAEVYAGDAIVPVLTAGAGRDVVVEADADGLRVSGVWRYASGIDLADWAIFMTLPGTPRLVLVPRAAVTARDGTWDVLGMRATGSREVTLDRVPVPAHRVVDWNALQRGDSPGAALHAEPTYRMPVNALLSLTTAVPIVAIAGGVVDLYLEAIAARTPVGAAAPQAQDPAAQALAARAASEIHMAWQLLMADADDLAQAAARGESPSVEVRARIRMDAATATRTAVRSADRLFEALGGALLPSGTPLERAFRDLHAMASHFMLQPGPAAAVYGRVLLGLDPPPNPRI